MLSGFVVGPSGKRINPATHLTAGGILDILSMARIHGVKISVSWFEEGEYYVLTVIKGNCVKKYHITDTELDNARNDEGYFHLRLVYAIHEVTSAYELENKKVAMPNCLA